MAGGIFMLVAFLIMLVFAVIAEVCLIKLINKSNEQFSKYNAENSNVLADSIEDLIRRLNEVPNIKITDISNTTDTVKFKANKRKYTLNFKNGIVSVEYKYPKIEGKPEPSKFFKVIKLSKDAQKATVVNSIMDYLSGKDSKENNKVKSKLSNTRRTMELSTIVMIISMCIGIGICLSGKQSDGIDNVKSTLYSGSISYGDIVNYYVPNQEWTVFNSETDTACVEVNGTDEENNQICIQFLGDLGLGLNNMGSQKFEMTYFELNGEPIDVDVVLDMACEALG